MMDYSLTLSWFCLLLTMTMTKARIECDPKNPLTVPHYDPNANRTQGVYYGGNFVCRLTCNGYCDTSPAWRPALENAFKCQCPVVKGCNKDGPITEYEENGDQFPRCKKLKSCNCNFQKNALQPFNLKYDCYYCAMQPNNWSTYYACCPILP